MLYVFLHIIGMFMGCAYAQSVHVLDSIVLEFYYEPKSTEINLNYKDNGKKLAVFTKDFIEARENSSLILEYAAITSASSPEGAMLEKKFICDEQANSFKSYLCESLSLSDTLFQITEVGVPWNALARMILEDNKIPGQKEAYDIATNYPLQIFRNDLVVDGRKRQLLNLRAGQTWRYMQKNQFLYLSGLCTCVVYFRNLKKEAELLAKSQKKEEPKVEKPVVSTPIKIDQPVYRPVFAVKTNLLFDIATLVNVGFELPIGQHWSVNSELYFPWWRMTSKNITLQTITGFVEPRYWFGKHSHSDKMTGFFIGAHVGAGYYDLQFGNGGVQSNSLFMGGLSCGFVHRITKNMRMEYSVGVGYVQTKYSEYYPVKETEFGDIKVHSYPWESNNYSGFLPTKLNISLIWIINRKEGRK